MKKSSTILLLAVSAISIGLVIYMATHRGTSEKTPATDQVAQQTSVTPSYATIPDLGTDTLHLVFNKEVSRKVILPALENSYSAIQSSPTLTGDKITQAQQVMQFIAANIYKKWPDLKQQPPVPAVTPQPAPASTAPPKK